MRRPPSARRAKLRDGDPVAVISAEEHHASLTCAFIDEGFAERGDRLLTWREMAAGDESLIMEACHLPVQLFKPTITSRTSVRKAPSPSNANPVSSPAMSL